MTKGFTITINESIQKKLEEVSKKENKPYSEKVRGLMRRYLLEKDTVPMAKMEYNLWQFKRDFNTFRTRKIQVSYSFTHNNELLQEFIETAREKKMSVSSLLELVLAYYLYPLVRRDREWARDNF